MTCELTPLQLCDLVNYVLSLPERSKDRIIHERISAVVVDSWRVRPTRCRVERWCDLQLELCGMTPTRKKSAAGRPESQVPPPQLWMFAPNADWRKRQVA